VRALAALFFECARARRPLALTRALFSAPLSPRGSLLKYYRYKKEGSLAGWRGIPADAAASAGGAEIDEDNTAISAIMTLSRDCAVISLEDTRQDAINIMAARRVRHLVRGGTR
jgi:hypothetical protein